MRILEYLQSPFRSGTKLSKPLLLLFILINAIVLYNAIFHDPRIGYDTSAFLRNIEVLSDFRIPTKEDTSEFFTPPLAFVLPAFFEAGLEALIPDEYLHPPNEYRIPSSLYYRFFQSIPLFPFPKFSLALAAKFAQLLNVGYSLILTFVLLKIGRLVYPERIDFRIFSLISLGILPVYYKTFAFVRPEPQLAALSVMAIYISLKIFVEKNLSLRYVSLLGITMGLIILSRQWGFFVLGAIALYACYHLTAKTIESPDFLKTTLISFSIALLIGGWFYLHLYERYGSVTAFNKRPISSFSLALHPPRFYFGLGLDNIFLDPVDRSIEGQILPIFYSEIWGDYWQFFTVRGIDRQFGAYIDGNFINTREAQMKDVSVGERRWVTNRFEINGYLGRVNLVSLFPTFLMLSGLASGIFRLTRDLAKARIVNSPQVSLFLFTLIIIVSLAGYLWFLVLYARPGPTEVKATYMLQIFPFLALLTAEFLMKIKDTSKNLLKATLIGILVVFLHNLPTLFTNYNTYWLSNRAQDFLP